MSDPRLRKELLAVLEDGHDVDIISLRGEDQPVRELSKDAKGLSRTGTSWPQWDAPIHVSVLGLLLGPISLYVTVLNVNRRYDAVQVNTLPDALAFSAIIPRLRGARVVADFQELMPEMLSAEFPGHRRLTKLLRAVERRAARFADHAIIATPAQADTFSERTDIRHWTLVPNVPEEGLFAPRPGPRPRSRHARVITHGTLVERYGAHVLIRALPRSRERYDVRLDIVGVGEQLPTADGACPRARSNAMVTFSQRRLTAQELTERIRAADIGVVSLLSHEYLERVTPSKLFDYVASGLPVVASETGGVRAWFNGTEVQFCEPGNPESLSEALAMVLADPRRAKMLAANALKTYPALRWSHQKRIYQAIFGDGKRRSDGRRRGTGASVGEQKGASPEAGQTDISNTGTEWFT